MANFFYYDQVNQKQGPVTEQQLKELAAQGVISLNSPMETDTGHKGTAGQIPGLFAAAPPPFTQSTAAPPPVANLFCTNCGAAVSAQAVACMSCGAKPIGHRRYCRYCGTALNPEQVVCVRCGSAISTAGVSRSVGGGANAGAPKNRIVAGLLGILLGGFGVHKFYLGSWGWGLVYVLTTILGNSLTWFILFPLAFITFGIGLILFIPAAAIFAALPVVALIEGIMYLVMSDEAFAEKYSPENQAPFRW